MDDLYFMQIALQEAELAFEEGEIPVGAIITIDNHIIARAHNLTERLNDVTAHAEMQAVTMAANYLGGKYLRDCTMYLTLEPCAMCAGAYSLAWCMLLPMTNVVIVQWEENSTQKQRLFTGYWLNLPHNF